MFADLVVVAADQAAQVAPVDRVAAAAGVAGDAEPVRGEHLDHLRQPLAGVVRG